MNVVSAIIVTRGDVDLTPILDSLPQEWEKVVWNNDTGPTVRVYDGSHVVKMGDLSVYGRYAAIEYATGDLIYVQDDDCVVSDPQAIVDALRISGHPGGFKGYFEGGWRTDLVVCNMPPEFRHDFYVDHALVGFGAAFHRSAPARAWGRLTAVHGDAGFPRDWAYGPFLRTCDVVFTALTPRVLVDVPKTDLPYANDDNRMWRQPEHQAERARMLDLVKKVG